MQSYYYTAVIKRLSACKFVSCSEKYRTRSVIVHHRYACYSSRDNSSTEQHC